MEIHEELRNDLVRNVRLFLGSSYDVSCPPNFTGIDSNDLARLPSVIFDEQGTRLKRIETEKEITLISGNDYESRNWRNIEAIDFTVRLFTNLQSDMKILRNKMSYITNLVLYLGRGTDTGETASVTKGSSTVTTSADLTGSINPGDNIKIGTLVFEVKYISASEITLYKLYPVDTATGLSIYNDLTIYDVAWGKTWDEDLTPNFSNIKHAENSCTIEEITMRSDEADEQIKKLSVVIDVERKEATQ